MPVGEAAAIAMAAKAATTNLRRRCYRGGAQSSHRLRLRLAQPAGLDGR